MREEHWKCVILINYYSRVCTSDARLAYLRWGYHKIDKNCFDLQAWYELRICTERKPEHYFVF